MPTDALARLVVGQVPVDVIAIGRLRFDRSQSLDDGQMAKKIEAQSAKPKE
jgi:hypothetical protein